MEDLKSTLTSFMKSVQCDVERLDAKVDALTKLADRIEVENLPKIMAWAMDSGDRELWLSVWSDDIYYRVPQYNIEINGTEALREFGEAAIFTREERRFSAITNIIVDVRGDTAMGRDYFIHYGFPIDPDTGKASEEHTIAEGMHFYEFDKQGGVWKITKMEVYMNRYSADGEEVVQR